MMRKLSSKLVEVKYRVRTNYWTISLDHIFNNTKRKYMKLLASERGMSAVL
jgi:hypothetical protein